MEYNIFGKTNRKVSRIGFGGAPAGLKNYLQSYNPDAQKDREDIIKAIHRAIELGINFFDTAPSYGDGKGEEIFGEALEGVNKEDIFLATKVSIGRKDQVRRSLEASLKRLRRDYVDLLQVHGEKFTVEEAEIVEREMLDEMNKLKGEGLVKYIGFTSENNNEPVFRFIKHNQFDTVMLLYNFIYQHPYDPSRPFGSMLEAEKRGMGIIVMKPTTAGTVQKWIQQVNPENTFNYTNALIQFVLSNPMVDVAPIGMRNVQEVELNAKNADNKLERVDIAELHNRYVK